MPYCCDQLVNWVSQLLCSENSQLTAIKTTANFLVLSFEISHPYYYLTFLSHACMKQGAWYWVINLNCRVQGVPKLLTLLFGDILYPRKWRQLCNWLNDNTSTQQFETKNGLNFSSGSLFPFFPVFTNVEKLKILGIRKSELQEISFRPVISSVENKN